MKEKEDLKESKETRQLNAMHDPWLNPGSIFTKSIKNIIGMIKKLWLWTHSIISM